MAKTLVYDYSTTAGSNTDIDGVDSTGSTGRVKDGDNYARSIMAHIAKFADDLGAVNTVGGTATAVTVTLAQGFTAYGTGAGEIGNGTVIALKMIAAATGAATLNVNSLGTKKIRRQGDAAIEANDWLANGIYFLRYDTAYDSANGAWVLMNPAFSATSVETTWQNANQPINLSLSATVATNALTIAIKGHDGNDPSSSNKVYVPFRSATAGSGDNDVLTLTAATSLVISSGSTMGFTSGTIGRLWIVGFNDGGTFRLGAVNCLSGGNVLALRDGIYSSTAEGGAGGADSAQVIYTGTAVTSKAMTILGYLEATEATAGAWATAPSLVKTISPGEALPGTVVQTVRTDTGASATGTTTIPYDNTIPQNTEGDQYMSLSVTPRMAANVLRVQSVAVVSSTAGLSQLIAALFKDSVANALAATTATVPSTTCVLLLVLNYSGLAGSVSSISFKVRAGASGAGTTTFNGGASTASIFNGVANSFILIDEVMA